MSIPVPTVNVRPRVGPTELQYYWSPPVSEWIAVGYNTGSTVCIAKSTDGLTWTASSGNPFSGITGRGIAWNGSYWIAVGANGVRTVCIAKSTDGDTWTPSTNNPFSTVGYPDSYATAVAWNGSYWVAVGFSQDFTICIAKSTDGMTWSVSTNNPFSGGQGEGIAWNGSYWVAVGYNSDNTVCIAQSTDGDTWTNATDNPFSGGIGEGIAWNGSYWVAVGHNSAYTVSIAKSTDGLTWANATDNPFSGGIYAGGYGVAWNGSYWVVVGSTSSPYTVAIAKSSDGLTWTTSTNNPFSGGSGRGISWSGGYWLAVGKNTGNTVCIAKSTDGLTWTNAIENPFSGGVAYGIVGQYNVTGFVLESVSPSVSVSLGPTETTKTVTGLTTDTNYSFTIKTDIGGSYSAAIPFRTVHTSAKPGPVATLTKSQSIVGGELNVTFSWTNPGDYADYYLVGLRAAAGTKDSIYSGTSQYATLSRTFTGLDPTRAYTFNIQRGNDAGYSVKTSITTTATTVFNPTTVPGLHLWLDAADVSGNGSTVADGTTVTIWYDKSGEANNGSATTGALIQTDSLGRYLDFTGSSWYDLLASSWAYNQYYTIFVVDKPTDYAANYSLVGRQAVSTDSFYIQYNATDGIRLSSQGDNAALGDTFESLTAPVNVWCFTNYGGKTAYWNRLISGKNPVAAAYITDSLLSIGAKQGGSDPYNGKMREVLIYTGIMSETNREAVTTYLYNKWYTQPTLIPLMPAENGTVLWLDGADINTFFQDLSGTIPVPPDVVTGIALWKDKSGFENDMTVPSGAQYRPNTGNMGLPGFFASNRTIETANYLQTGDASLFLVGWTPGGITDYFFKHDSSGNFGLNYTSGSVSWGESATTNNNQFPYTDDKYMFYGTMRKGQLIAGTFITNGNIYTSYAVDTLVLPVAAAPITLSHSVNVAYFEVIYYNRVLTASEIQQNAAYLSSKWSIGIPSSAVFSPPAAPGLQLWLDSSDPYTVFKTGDTVIAWKDRSGSGIEALPHGAPTVNNGIVFDGSGQYFSLPDGALPRANYSYYVVTDVSGSSSIIHGGSRDISGQMFVAAGSGIAVSYDLLYWIAPTTPLSDSRGIVWNGSYWVAVGTGSSNTIAIAKSTDGITWTQATDNPFSGGQGYGIAWNGSYWVAVGNNTGNTVCIAKSTDGMTWTTSDNPFSGGQGQGIAWNGSYWVAVGFSSGSTVCIAKSTDGDTWTNATNNPFSGNAAMGIAWNGSYWVALGANTDNTVCMAKSTDGDTWTNVTNNPFSGGFAYAAAWNGSYWVAVGFNSVYTVSIAKSTDGLNWTAATNNLFNTCYGIVWFGSYWAAGGSGASGAIATSTDGLTWTRASDPFPGGNGFSVATGNATVHNSLMDIKVAATYATTVFNSISISSLTDTNAIPSGSTTVIVESIYNGTGKSLFLSGIAGGTDSSIRYQDASNNYIGWDMSGTYMNGTIKEILVYGASHTSTQRKQVEKYLKDKWYPSAYEPTGTSLWLDSAAANLTLSGTNVTSWNDRSGNGNNFTQSAAWAQPIYSLDAVTGLYGLQFAANGIANGLKSSTSPFGATSSWSVFMVQRYDFSTSVAAELVNNNICTAYDISGNDPTAFSIGTTDTATPSTSEIQLTAAANVDTATKEIHKAPVLTSQVVNSLEYENLVNGSTVASHTLTQAMTSAGKLQIGFTGALTPALGGAMRGYIYEIVVFNTTVASEDQHKVEGYLAWKWGIQGSLPTTHPYYLAPP